jgi:phosphoglycerate dehydrogenase-like enzyme
MDQRKEYEMIKTVIMANNVPFHDGDIVEYVYGEERLLTIRSMTELHPVRITSENFDEERAALAEVEVIFSCWGMLPLTAEQLDALPNLKAVFYASGSVNSFAQPFLERGIVVCSAADANAIPVAEFCLAQILLSCKGAYLNSQLCRRGPWKQSEMPVGKGVYGETVALLGIGAISRHLLKLLKPFNLRIVAVSNYLSSDEAAEMGIDALVTIEQAFHEGYIVSNHLADKPSTIGVLTEELFATMRQGATFINTGRGAQVNEEGLANVLQARHDLTALLDVQHPEPPQAGSRLYTLPNVHMTSHIAGSSNDEVRRMADYMIEEFKRWQNNDALLYAVEPTVLARRA